MNNRDRKRQLDACERELREMNARIDRVLAAHTAKHKEDHRVHSKKPRPWYKRIFHKKKKVTTIYRTKRVDPIDEANELVRELLRGFDGNIKSLQLEKVKAEKVDEDVESEQAS